MPAAPAPARAAPWLPDLTRAAWEELTVSATSLQTPLSTQPLDHTVPEMESTVCRSRVSPGAPLHLRLAPTATGPCQLHTQTTRITSGPCTFSWWNLRYTLTAATAAEPLARSNPAALSLNSSKCSAAKANPFCWHARSNSALIHFHLQTIKDNK